MKQQKKPYIPPTCFIYYIINYVMEQQKKPYEPPTTEVTETKPEEPIACSYYEEHSGKPGHGWGDKNHDHYGPPGQNKKHGITDIWEDL